MYENQTQSLPTAILAGVDTGEYEMELSIDELRELAASAGYETAGVLTQRRESSAGRSPTPPPAWGPGAWRSSGILSKTPGRMPSSLTMSFPPSRSATWSRP